MSPRYTVVELAQLAADAVATDGQTDLFDYWCELAELIAGFAIRTTGYHVQVPADETEGWLMFVGQDSAACALCIACDLARPERSPPFSKYSTDARLLLTEFFGGLDQKDYVGQAALILDQAARCVTLASARSAAHRTSLLLDFVTAAAREFEASWSPKDVCEAMAKEDWFWKVDARRRNGRAAFLYVRDREYAFRRPLVSVALLGDPAPPRPGDVDRALAHCSLLAQGRLLHGERIASREPRYSTGSLLFRPPPPLGGCVLRD